MDEMKAVQKERQAVVAATAPYDWKKTAWRATRAALVSAGAVLADVMVNALAGAADDPERIGAIFGGGARGKALAAVMVTFGIGAAIRNWWKNRHRE